MPELLSHALTRIQRRLEGRSAAPRLDAQVLAAHILRQSRAFLAAHPETPLSAHQAVCLEQAVQRLEAGEPLPYVLGHWEFYGLDFLVSPAVLIPRPETELLVEMALKWMAQHNRYQVMDVGAGSGCIAISLAVGQPKAQLTAVDISPAALAIAHANAARHGVEQRVACVQADLLPPSCAAYDLLCANLPYIPTAALDDLPALRFEPRSALDGGADGLDLIRRLLNLAAACLRPHAALLLEIEAGQAAAALAAARQAFPLAQAQVHVDLAGRDRLLAIQT